MTANASRLSPNDRNFWIANTIVSIAAVSLLGWILVLREPTGDTRALAFMPAVNATMNGIAASCLVAGYLAIRARKRMLHRNLMIASFVASAIFLVGYLVYHYAHGDTRYPEDAPFRAAYLVMLASHVVLSIIVFPMVLGTFYLSLTNQFARHRKLARWTLPIWLYVSVTGVAVFLMLRLAVG